jgi:hypothetical protein
MNGTEHSPWLEVIAKCLCYTCLQQSPVTNSSMLERAKFLSGFGLSREDCAGVLGTTAHSLAELERQARKRKGVKHVGKKK